MQTAATQVVAELPESLKHVGQVVAYPATSAIMSLREDGGGIRSDSGMILLQTLVRNVEDRLVAAEDARRQLESRWNACQERAQRLEVENAQLKERNAQAKSDRDARSIFLGIGGVGLGVAGQIAVVTPTPLSVFFSFVFAGLLICGYTHPAKTREK